MSYVTLSNGAKGLVGSSRADGRSTFVYDTNSRVKATIDASGARTSFVRNTAGLVTAQINAASFRTSFVYNGNGQRTATIDPLASRSTTIYDTIGNVLAQINPLSKRSTFSYVRGQKTSAKSPAGAVSTSIYDLNNRVLGQVDPLGLAHPLSTNPAPPRLPRSDRMVHEPHRSTASVEFRRPSIRSVSEQALRMMSRASYSQSVAAGEDQHDGL
jgi:YD repeat-containing protein